jgi:hypothetical protein
VFTPGRAASRGPRRGACGRLKLAQGTRRPAPELGRRRRAAQRRSAPCVRTWPAPNRRWSANDESPVGVGADRGPGAITSWQSGAAKYIGRQGPGCCCCARAERLTHQVIQACGALALPGSECRTGATGRRMSCPQYRRLKISEDRGESRRLLLLQCVPPVSLTTRLCCVPPTVRCLSLAAAPM